MRARVVLALALALCLPATGCGTTPTTVTPAAQTSSVLTPAIEHIPFAGSSVTPLPLAVLSPRQFTVRAAAVRTYPWHTGIVATTFWVGELFNASLADGSQVCSTYDSKWALHWAGISTGKVPSKADGCPGSPVGGCDGISGSKGSCKTEARRAPDFWPSKANPRENPFYLDLPYDDINDSKAFKTRCTDIPWAAGSSRCKDSKFSFMKNRWVHIIGGSGRDCYGQIEDAGPSHGSLYHDAAYVFGSKDVRPAQKQFNRAGMDVSPALNGCLGFKELDGDTDKVKWQFVDAPPAGPWTKVVTASGVTP